MSKEDEMKRDIELLVNTLGGVLDAFYDSCEAMDASCEAMKAEADALALAIKCKYGLGGFSANERNR